MLRLNILPEGYIYPKEERPVSDLLRRRLLFVKHRTAHILSLQSMISRNPGTQMSCRAIKRLDGEAPETLFDSPHLVLAAKSNIAVIHFLKERIASIEKAVRPHIKLREEFRYLLTVPGIGDILALTIMLEVGDIARFPKVGDYSSPPASPEPRPPRMKPCDAGRARDGGQVIVGANGKKRMKITERMATDTSPGHM